MANEYDNLALNTPTFLRTEGDVDIWATRTTNGGTVERRIRSNTNTDRALILQARAQQAISTNSTFLALASPTNAQSLAQIQALTRQLQALLRLSQNALDAID